MSRNGVTAIADEITCSWLQLGGVGKVYPISNPNEAEAILRELQCDETIALILVSPEVAQANVALIETILEKVYPIVLTLPTEKIESDEEEPLERLVRLATGIRIKL